MSVRMRVHDREPIGQALRRFKKLLEQRGVLWAMYSRPKQFVPATQSRRKKQFKKRYKARLATLRAQQAGEQPVASLDDAAAAFRKREGKR